MADYPDGFLWGVATSALQVEGVRGREPSVWDTFAARPGAIADGSTPAIACDSVTRIEDDLALLGDLGATAYRFSVSWPRVEASGLGYYDRLVDGLLARGVAPMATLFHWDTPQHVEDEGGWRSSATASLFAEYAGAVAAHLGDRVTHWVTINEPREVTMLGHALGVHAPGHHLGFDALPVAHELLRAHGLATRAIRAATVAGSAAIGLALSHSPVTAATDDEADRQAADLFDLLNHRLFADPILLGGYPAEIAELMPTTDLDAVAEPIDFLGLNYYNPTRVAAPGSEAATSTIDGVDVGGVGDALPFAFVPVEAPVTDLGWPIVPRGLADQLRILRERYPGALPPLIITENGAALADDRRRIAFLEDHLGALREAIAAGADVRGYLHWSLLDNWEWAEGFGPRFGLVAVDPLTQERTPKPSFAWLRDHIAAAVALRGRPPAP
ncbi:MAG: family 1 glycosylhydrolase [Nocardioides sp.]|uniref:glycoside hydrolase family 1 protein n=1 Tax=Nocardioides sp. TaxID=35761 RepID=UPI0039E53A00